MSMGKYILSEDGQTPVEEPDLHKWANWFETADRTVKRETIGESDVSTVFLGLDHNWGGGEPFLWETMVFGGPWDQEQDRCGGTRDDALAMHEHMAKRVRPIP